MTTISHREMRNNSSEVLRRVERGEAFTITNRGEPVARLIPVQRNVLDELIAKGEVRMPTRSWADYEPPERREGTAASAEILADIRGYDR